jgi:hypothetical protein
LAQTIAEARGRLRTLVGRGDLIESLYFGWFDRPYRRATLACALKTLATLEYELKLRRLGKGAMDGERLERIIRWLQSAPQRACQDAKRSDFGPHRVQIDSAAWSAIGVRQRSPDLPPALFGFIDRATATRHEEHYGDFDLLACLGLRVVGKGGFTSLVPDDWRSLLRHADALGVAMTVDRPQSPGWGAAETGAVAPAIPVIPGQLADFVRPQHQAAAGDATVVPAITDPAAGESWPESLARRALYRGATGCDGAVVVGWSPPRRNWDTEDLADQVRLAMWVHALDGQRLALLEGWRDLRDGSASPYPSITAEPTLIEAVAATALDLLFFREFLGAIDRRRPVAALVGADSLDPGDDNRWSEQCAALFAELVTRRIRFDVVPESRLPDALGANQYVVAVGPADEALSPEAQRGLAQLRAAGGTRIVWQPDRATAEAVVVPIARRLSTSGAGEDRLVVTGPAGQQLRDILVFHGRGGRLAIANLAAAPRSVWITTRSGRPTPALHDLLTEQAFNRPDEGLEVPGWQVRLLVPAAPGHRIP